MEVVHSNRVRVPAVPLSNAVRSGNHIFVSGTTPYTADRKIAVGDFEAQMRQVMENVESTKRQYALRERAVALGWPLERIHVVDSDLGQSGAFDQRRAHDLAGDAIGRGPDVVDRYRLAGFGAVIHLRSGSVRERFRRVRR